MRAHARVAGIVFGSALIALAGAGPLAAQDLESRVREAGSTSVSFRFDTWPDVERCSGGWQRRGSDSPERTRRSRECFHGPMEVRLDLVDGRVQDLDSEIVRREAAPEGRGRHLGTVSPEEAAMYLLDLVERADEDVAEEALGAAMVANEVETWPRTLEIARNRELDAEIRAAATFWVGQATADQVLEGLRSLLDDPEREVRQTALFALSENQGDAAVPMLMEIAEGDGDPELRRAAFFWLSQKDDPRVLPFFERILRNGGA